MPQELIVWLIAGWFLAFLMLGQAVATCLLGAGLVGITLWIGPNVLVGIIGPDIFYTASTYTLSIIPLYVLMAQLLQRGGVILDLFRAAHRLAGYRRFPLGAATIVTGGMLGAVSGSGVASAAALATLASPELQRVGYTQRFSVTLAALSGSLSTIIPPSLLIMIYGSIASVPIGHLFMGAVGPAVLCMLVYLACLFLFGETAPDAGAQMSAAEGIQEDIPRNSMAAFAFVLFLMAVVFGGIYGGIVTVGEAGALGAFTALLGLSAMRRIGVRDVVDSLCESVKISAMLIILLIGAQIFSRFLSFSRIPTELLVLSQPLLEHPYLLVGVLMAGLFIAGIILEEVTIMVLAIPLILPMLEAAQIDLVWFGVMACFIISLGLLTPPVGFVTFAAATAAKVPATSIFGPVMLFATIAAIVVTASMMLYPQIITWLPSRME